MQVRVVRFALPEGADAGKATLASGASERLTQRFKRLGSCGLVLGCLDFVKIRERLGQRQIGLGPCRLGQSVLKRIPRCAGPREGIGFGLSLIEGHAPL